MPKSRHRIQCPFEEPQGYVYTSLRLAVSRILSDSVRRRCEPRAHLFLVKRMDERNSPEVLLGKAPVMEHMHVEKASEPMCPGTSKRDIWGPRNLIGYRGSRHQRSGRPRDAKQTAKSGKHRPRRPREISPTSRERPQRHNPHRTCDMIKRRIRSRSNTATADRTATGCRRARESESAKPTSGVAPNFV